jgi:hypothetical protein
LFGCYYGKCCEIKDCHCINKDDFMNTSRKRIINICGKFNNVLVLNIRPDVMSFNFKINLNKKCNFFEMNDFKLDGVNTIINCASNASLTTEYTSNFVIDYDATILTLNDKEHKLDFSQRNVASIKKIICQKIFC